MRWTWAQVSLCPGVGSTDTLSRDVAPFEDVRDQLRANEIDAVFDVWFNEQLGITNVEVNPRFGRFDTETGQVLPIRSTAQEPAGGTGSTRGTTGAATGSTPGSTSGP